MSDRKLFGSKKEIEGFAERLKKIRTLDGGWSTEYVDIETGKHWIEYLVDDRAFLENLMLISPKPTTDELIDIAFMSHYPDEVSAAATRLTIEERNDKIEFRQKLLTRLSQIDLLKLDQQEKERIKIIIFASQLIDGGNKREIVGKNIVDIQSDASFFEATSKKAKEILNGLR